MLRIAICNDDTVLSSQLYQLVHKFSNKISTGVKTEIDLYIDGIKLISAIETGVVYDLVILDWDMKVMNGEAIGRSIRRIDEDTLLIFIGFHAEYAVKAIRLTTFRYIIKNLISNELPKALRSAYDCRLIKEKMIFFRTIRKSEACVKVKDILYVEVHACQTLIVTKRSEYKSSSRTFIKDHKSLFIACGFTCAYKGLIVNIREIQEVFESELQLSNGKMVPLSRHYKKEIMSALAGSTI